MASIVQSAKTGKWRARIARAGHTSISKVFKTQKDAIDWVRITETKQDGGTTFPTKETKQLRVDSLFIRYRDEVTVQKKSCKWEKKVINRLRQYDFVRRRLDQIKPHDIKDWLDERKLEISGRSGKPVQDATIAREGTVISSIFTHAIKEWGYTFLNNPIAAVKMPSKKGNLRKQRWKEADIQKILKAANWDETKMPKLSKDYTPWAFLIAIETAMREGELAKLTVADFFPNERYVVCFDTKNGLDRDVPLSTQAVKWLKFITKGKKPTDKIFNTTANSLSVTFGDLKKIAKLTKADGFDMTFHDGRHEATTRLSKKFSNILELSAVTGHLDIKQLKRYYNPTISELADRIG
jgi:integrase